MPAIIFKYVVFVLLLYSHSGHAEIYKWVDEDGRTHYDEKPVGENASKLEIKTDKNVDGYSGEINADRDKLLEVMEEERLFKEKERNKARQEKKELETRCAKLKDKIQEMGQGGVVYYELDDNGERVYIDEAKHRAEVDKLKKSYDKHCH